MAAISTVFLRPPASVFREVSPATLQHTSVRLPYIPSFPCKTQTLIAPSLKRLDFPARRTVQFRALASYSPQIRNSSLPSDSIRTVSFVLAAAFAVSRCVVSVVKGCVAKFNDVVSSPSSDELAALQKLQGNLVCTVGPLFFAAVRSSSASQLNTPLTVVASGLARWLDIYSGVLMVRVLLSWFPNIPWDRQPLSAIRDLCDPYLNLFRNIIPPVFDTLDSIFDELAFMFSGTIQFLLLSTKMEDYMHQFPAFGSWDMSAITQYMDSGRRSAGFHEPCWDLYTPAAIFHIQREGTAVAKRVQPVKEKDNWKQEYKVCEVVCSPVKTGRTTKAMDEDLYKIPPEFLRKNRRPPLKILSFFSSVFRSWRICY